MKNAVGPAGPEKEAGHTHSREGRTIDRCVYPVSAACKAWYGIIILTAASNPSVPYLFVRHREQPKYILEELVTDSPHGVRKLRKGE